MQRQNFGDMQTGEYANRVMKDKNLLKKLICAFKQKNFDLLESKIIKRKNPISPK